jgi:serine phosphatase RsbU (regulator of sigma subunit)
MIYQNDIISVSGGERLIFITDGCYEWGRNAENSGWEPFVNLMDAHQHGPALEIWESLRNRIREQHGNELEDDCTLITLEIHQ